MTKLKVVVFPLRGRNWCFAPTIRSAAASDASPPPSWAHLWSDVRHSNHKTELLVDFLAIKMNRAWEGLAAAPAGSLKKRVHDLGLRLLSNVKPSENLLKSVSKDVKALLITYPPSLNPRLVRRRLRHVAMRGCAIHRKYLYVSMSLLPLTTAFSVLPLPNVPFFWILFRTYSNWRALQGSQRLLHLVSNSSNSSSAFSNSKGDKNQEESKHVSDEQSESPLDLNPSEDLEKLLLAKDSEDCLNDDTISNICESYNLNRKDVIKYRETL